MQTANNTLTNKSAVFTLGMTILAMVHLSDLHYLYNFSTYTINVEEIGLLTGAIHDTDLRNILGKMLKFHSYERITFTELEEMLYEIIQESEMKGQKSAVCLQHHDEYQVSTLEESIVRIKQSRAREPSFGYQPRHPEEYQEYHDPLPVNFFS